MKLPTLKTVTLSVLIASTLLDGIMAVLCRIKHPIFNESNPIYLMTDSLAIALAFKALVVAILFYIFYDSRWYHFFKTDVARFGLAIMLLLLIIAQFNGFASAWDYYFTPVEMMQPIPKEELVSYYVQTMYAEPPQQMQGGNHFSLLYLFVFMILTFMAHKSFEKENKLPKISKFNLTKLHLEDL